VGNLKFVVDAVEKRKLIKVLQFKTWWKRKCDLLLDCSRAGWLYILIGQNKIVNSLEALFRLFRLVPIFDSSALIQHFV
jgi:hypothetical protein